MFGFLRPACASLEYRQAYARCCMRQHLDYGVTALPFLSYEAVFLYLAAIDAGAIAPPSESTPRCCRLRTSRSLEQAADAGVAQYCAALGMLLSSIKIEDDLRDSRSTAARLIAWKSASAWKRATAFFQTLDADFGRQTAGFIEQHLALERTGEPIELVAYCRPTADAFAHVFALLATAAPSPNRSWRTLLARLGSRIGAAIIAFDCAVDWTKDRRRGEFNPLPDHASRLGALDLAAAELAAAAEDCRQTLGEKSRSSAVLDSAGRRVSGTRRALAAAPRERTPRNRFSLVEWLREWYDVTQRRSVQLGFDCPGCDCPGCDCDCSGCDSCGCDSGDAAAAGGEAAADCACHCCNIGDVCWRRRGKKSF